MMRKNRCKLPHTSTNQTDILSFLKQTHAYTYMYVSIYTHKHYQNACTYNPTNYRVHTHTLGKYSYNHMQINIMHTHKHTHTHTHTQTHTISRYPYIYSPNNLYTHTAK